MWRWWKEGFLVRHKSKKFWTPLGKLLVVRPPFIGFLLSLNTFKNLLTISNKFTKYVKKPMFQGGNFTMITCLLNIRACIQTYLCVTPKPYEKIMQKWFLATVWVQQNPQISHQDVSYSILSHLSSHLPSLHIPNSTPFSLSSYVSRLFMSTYCDQANTQRKIQGIAYFT